MTNGEQRGAELARLAPMIGVFAGVLLLGLGAWIFIVLAGAQGILVHEAAQPSAWVPTEGPAGSHEPVTYRSDTTTQVIPAGMAPDRKVLLPRMRKYIVMKVCGFVMGLCGIVVTAISGIAMAKKRAHLF